MDDRNLDDLVEPTCQVDRCGLSWKICQADRCDPDDLDDRSSPNDLRKDDLDDLSSPDDLRKDDLADPTCQVDRCDPDDLRKDDSDDPT